MNATPPGPSDGDPDEGRFGLMSLVSNLPGMVYRCRNDRERSAELVSAGVARICGHAPAAFTSGRMHWGQIIHPDDRDRVRTALQEAIREGRPYRFDYRIRHRDGSERWVWEQGQAVCDAGGAPVVLEGYVTDVTADRQAALAAEEQVRQRLAELDDLYRNAPVGLCQLDRELRFLRINERLAEINGIPAAEHLGKTVRELMPQLADAVEPDLNHVLESGQPRLNIEIVSETPAQPGLQRVWRDQCVPVKDAAGRVTGLSIAVEETTARKDAEAALARERDLLQAVLNSAGKAHLVYLDCDFNFVRVNETYAATCGYRPEEMIGKNHFALYPHAENAAIFRRVRDTGKPFEVRDKPFEFPDHPERGLTYWDWTLIPVKDRDGQVTGLIFSLFETTARVRAEEALREREEQLRLFIEHAPVALAMFDREMRYVAVSARWIQDLRLGAQDLLGRCHYDLFPGLPERWKDAHRRGQAGETVRAEEDRYERNDGTVLWSHWEVRPWHRADGSVGGIVLFIEDITERKRAEEAQRLLLREHSRQEERQRLLQDIHDGFGSQLASARLRIEHGDLGQDEIAAVLRECLDDLYLVVDTMNEEDKTLAAALADYRYRCDTRLAGQALQLQWRIDVEDCPPLGQRTTLHILRLLQEALNNALKHARASRIALQAVFRPDRTLTLCVSDDGVGLPNPVQPGKGMSSMRRRAREIGATLEWTRLDPGTRVCATLPMSPNLPPRADG